MRRVSPLSITRVARLQGAGPAVALPALSLRLRMRDSPGAVGYFFVGDPDFSRTRRPWRYVEQMGDAHRLESDGRTLTVLTRKHGPFVTEARLIVSPGAGDD